MLFHLMKQSLIILSTGFLQVYSLTLLFQQKLRIFTKPLVQLNTFLLLLWLLNSKHGMYDDRDIQRLFSVKYLFGEANTA